MPLHVSRFCLEAVCLFLVRTAKNFIQMSVYYFVNVLIRSRSIKETWQIRRWRACRGVRARHITVNSLSTHAMKTKTRPFAANERRKRYPHARHADACLLCTKAPFLAIGKTFATIPTICRDPMIERLRQMCGIKGVSKKLIREFNSKWRLRHFSTNDYFYLSYY